MGAGSSCGANFPNTTNVTRLTRKTKHGTPWDCQAELRERGDIVPLALRFWSGGASSMPVGNLQVENPDLSNALNLTNSPIAPQPGTIWPIVRFLLATLILVGLMYFFRHR